MKQNDNDTASAKDRPLPGHETQSDEMACPKCGRFVGAATKCPYCGAKVEKRISLVALRWAAVLLSTVGLVLLYFMAKTREPERIRIGDIETTMNFGLVRLSGVVRNDPRPFKNGNGMGFNVSDDSGSIIVFVNQSQRKAMMDGGLVPRKGDTIDFVAQLQASSSGNSARIRSLNPASYKLSRTDGATTGSSPSRAAASSGDTGSTVPFSKIDESLVGKSVTLEGTVASIKEPDPGTRQPYVITLGDGADSVEVKVWADQYLQIADPKSLPGTAVRVKATVKLYKGKVELQLKKGADLRRAGQADVESAPKTRKAAPSAAAEDLGPAVPFSKIDESLVGKSVMLEGTVASIKEPDPGTRQPYVITLGDGADSVELKVWADQYLQIADPKSLPGTAVRVKATVKLYKGKVELQLKKGADLQRADDAVESSPAKGAGSASAASGGERAPVARKATVPVAEVSAADAGNYVTVEGALSGPSDRAGMGTAYKFTDASGSIQVVFWNSAIPADLQQKAAAAARVRVNGKVTNFHENLQIAPRAGGVEILE